jgi:hypothetical protein
MAVLTLELGDEPYYRKIEKDAATDPKFYPISAS